MPLISGVSPTFAERLKSLNSENLQTAAENSENLQTAANTFLESLKEQYINFIPTFNSPNLLTLQQKDELVSHYDQLVARIKKAENSSKKINESLSLKEHSSKNLIQAIGYNGKAYFNSHAKADRIWERLQIISKAHGNEFIIGSKPGIKRLFSPTFLVPVSTNFNNLRNAIKKVIQNPTNTTIALDPEFCKGIFDALHEVKNVIANPKLTEVDISLPDSINVAQLKNYLNEQLQLDFGRFNQSQAAIKLLFIKVSKSWRRILTNASLMVDTFK